MMLLPLIFLLSGVTIGQNLQVDISTKDITGQEGGGSGVIISKNTILTAAHVLEDVILATATCGEKTIGIKPIARSAQLDLALVEFIEDCPLQPVKLAAQNPSLASDIYIVGCPAGMCFTVTKGIVSGYRLSSKMVPNLYSDAKVWYGNSGGPAVDDQGNLIGILIQIKSFSTIEIEQKEMDVNSQNYSVMVPVDTVRIFLEAVRKAK